MQPEVIVLDEATAMLDPKGREEVLSTVRRLNKERGMTVVMITQFMEEAVDCDRVFVMAGGRLMMEGAPEEVFRERELLKGYGLDVPAYLELAFELKEAGMTLPGCPMRCEELSKALCRSL